MSLSTHPYGCMYIHIDRTSNTPPFVKFWKIVDLGGSSPTRGCLWACPGLFLVIYIEGRAAGTSDTSVRGFLEFQRVPDRAHAGSWHHTFFLIVQTAAEWRRFRARVPRGFQRVPMML